ncbi:tyrosine-type recombinase/integrase [Chitinophaga sp.]|uniref:tyrosine-type recombinase/integrase n=1 Tax=Chitinophaga sp. TaxID=1869181 RepID=UPI0031E09F9F
MTSVNYSPAVIYPSSLDLSVSKWYVIYRYTNPFTFRKEPFRVYEDINRKSGNEKIAYAIMLRDAVNLALAAGYSPYGEEELLIEEQQQQEAAQQALMNSVSLRHNYTVVQAYKFFIDQKKQEKKSKATITRYKDNIGLLLEWMNERNLLLTKARDLTADLLLSFLRDSELKRGWVGKTYNNYLTSLHAFLNLLSLNIHGIIEKNPIQGAPTRDTLARKHAAYDDQQLSLILSAVRNAKDRYMEGLILTSYYACIRAKSEMIALKAGWVIYDRNLIKIEAEDAKSRRDDYIPLDPILKAHFIAQGYDKLPADWHIFGNCGKPGPTPASANHYSRIFRPYRDQVGLEDRYTLYSFKHTRAIHLAMAGKTILQIMVLLRHKSPSETEIYLRDLGVLIERGAIEGSREI